jgi:hypothetical protein
VRAALHAELARLGILAPLRRCQLWLILWPSQSINSDVWRVVCLSAFACMDAGRSLAWLVPHTAPLTPGGKVARIVRNCALAAFYSMVAGYAALGICRPAAHTFFFAAHPHGARALGSASRNSAGPTNSAH